MNRIIPEYLALFPTPGEVKISVRFSKKDNAKIWIRAFSCSWPDIACLFHQDTKEPFKEMFFDEHLYEIKCYEINPGKSSITIVAGCEKETTPASIEARNRWEDGYL